MFVRESVKHLVVTCQYSQQSHDYKGCNRSELVIETASVSEHHKCSYLSAAFLLDLETKIEMALTTPFCDVQKKQKTKFLQLV